MAENEEIQRIRKRFIEAVFYAKLESSQEVLAAAQMIIDQERRRASPVQSDPMAKYLESGQEIWDGAEQHATAQKEAGQGYCGA